MADGGDDDDDDGDDGEDDENDDSEAPDTSTAGVDKEDDKTVDTTMSDAPPVAEVLSVEVADLAPVDKLPTNPMNLPPPTGSLAAGSPKIEGSPLKNVVLPPADAPQLDEPHPAADSIRGADADTVVGSTVAEPPSTIVGEEPEIAADRDLNLQPAKDEEALLPPPPEQVGNIASPKAEEVAERASDSENKDRDERQDDSSFGDKNALSHQDSIMTEDTIKPEDSASVQFPLNGSAAPSEADELKDQSSTLGAILSQPTDDAAPPASEPKAAEVADESAPAAPSESQPEQEHESHPQPADALESGNEPIQEPLPEPEAKSFDPVQAAVEEVNEPLQPEESQPPTHDEQAPAAPIETEKPDDQPAEPPVEEQLHETVPDTVPDTVLDAAEETVDAAVPSTAGTDADAKPEDASAVVEEPAPSAPPAEQADANTSGPTDT